MKVINNHIVSNRQYSQAKAIVSRKDGQKHNQENIIMPSNNNNISLKVRKIFETKGEFSRVSVDTETFNNVRGMSPILPYKAQGTVTGRGARIFNINGVELISLYDKETRKTAFYIQKDDAVKNLCSLEQQRAGEPKLNIAF